MSLLIQRKRCCCGDPEPPPCEVCPDAPALICPPKTGLSVTVSGVTLTTASGMYSWDGGNSISGTWCLYGDGCDAQEFRTLEPIKLGTWNPSDPDSDERIALYLYVRFSCTQLDDPGLFGSIGPQIEAHILGQNAFGADDVTDYPVVAAFSTREGTYGSGAAPTHTTWLRTCDFSGYVMNNAIPGYAPDPNLESNLIGTGGTVTTGGECGGGNCTACALTAVTATFTGGPLDGLTFDFDQGVVTDPTDSCGYSFDDGERYSGSIARPLSAPFDVGPIVAGGMVSLRMQVFDQDSPTPLVPVFDGYLICDGEDDPVLGRYGQDFPNPDPMGSPSNGPTYPGVWTPTIYADVS